MKTHNTFKIIAALLFLVIFILSFIFMFTTYNVPNGGIKYNCDVKNITLNTKIEITDENDNYIGTVQGNIIRFLTDPLTLTNGDTKIAYAGDSYNLITQDDHAIFVNDKVELYMIGKFNIVGNDYEIADRNGNVKYTCHFNMFTTKGELKDLDGNIIAVYSHNPIFRDYTVTIYDTDIDKNAILLLFASYHSDYEADNSN